MSEKTSSPVLAYLGTGQFSLEISVYPDLSGARPVNTWSRIMFDLRISLFLQRFLFFMQSSQHFPLKKESPPTPLTPSSPESKKKSPSSFRPG